MRTLLLNNTERYHAGTRTVVQVLDEFLPFDSSVRTSARHDQAIDFGLFDQVVLNGEGTMHHSAPRSLLFLQYLDQAQQAGCKTMLINSVWQDMTHEFDKVLKKCSFVSVREVFSRDEIAIHGVDATVLPDLSYFAHVPAQHFEHVQIYEGQYWPGTKRIDQFQNINIFKQSWHEIVNRLRNCDLFLTGRHHEMYAACKARCRFIVKPGNTWKNEGLLKSAGVDIPFDIDGALSGKYDSEYEQLWNYLDQFTREALQF